MSTSGLGSTSQIRLCNKPSETWLGSQVLQRPCALAVRRIMLVRWTIFLILRLSGTPQDDTYLVWDGSLSSKLINATFPPASARDSYPGERKKTRLIDIILCVSRSPDHRSVVLPSETGMLANLLFSLQPLARSTLIRGSSRSAPIYQLELRSHGESISKPRTRLRPSSKQRQSMHHLDAT